MDHTLRFVTESYRSRQPFSTQMISFKIQSHSQKSIADHAYIHWSGFLATVLTQYLSQRHNKWHSSLGSCLLPFKTPITGQSQSDSTSWRAVRESKVTMNSHSTSPLHRSLRMFQHLSYSQMKDLGLMCRENIKGPRNRIMQN